MEMRIEKETERGRGDQNQTLRNVASDLASLEDAEAERAMVSSYLEDPDVFLEHRTCPADYSSALYQYIVRVVQDETMAGTHLDSVSLVHCLKDRILRHSQICTLPELELAIDNARGSGMERFASTNAARVTDMAKRRRLAKGFVKSYYDAVDPALPIDRTVLSATKVILDSADSDEKGRFRSAREIFRDRVKEYADGGKELRKRSIFTGLSIDDVSGGWKPGQLVVIAARPGMGKTSVIIHTLVEAANAGKRVAFFSLEMKAGEVVDRMLCSACEIDNVKLTHGDLSKEEWKRVLEYQEKISETILINDVSGLTEADIVLASRRLQLREHIDCVAVDYLSRIRSVEKAESVAYELEHITNALKTLAKELEVPVLLAAQLNRDSARDEIRDPRLTDLKSSGAIEQDADVVLLLWKDLDKNGDALIGSMVKYKVAKNRNGRLGSGSLHFEGGYQRWSNDGAVKLR